MNNQTNSINSDKAICIVGSGLVGTLLSIYLAKAGFNVDVYEKRTSPKEDFVNRGRSIALSLSERGWNALRQVGLEESIRKNTKETFGRVVHKNDNTEHYQEYGDGSQAICTINRNYLNVTLLDEAVKTGKVKFFFQHQLKDLNEETGELTFDNLSSKEIINKKYDHIIGVDGLFSVVRRTLQEKKIWNFEEHTFDFGFKELSLSESPENGKLMPDDTVHVWPGEKFVLVSLPTHDGQFLSTLFLPAKGEDSFESLVNSEKIKNFFERQCASAVPFMPKLVEDFEKNPSSNLTQVKGGPWNYKDKVLLMGDACHATTPFYAMGMNTGFEDCSVFMSILKNNDLDLSKTFAEFAENRKPDADAMIQLSFENFSSLRESPDFNFEKKWILERRIWKLLPNLWTPIYVLITATNKPLREIPCIKKRQNSILDKIICENENALNISDEELISATLSAMQAVDSKQEYTNTK